MDVKLYQHQIDFLKENPNKSALVHSCGTGKTRTALEWVLIGETALVICPKALKTNWRREADKWGSKVVIYSKEEFRKEHKEIPKYSHIIVDEVHNGFLTPHFKSQMSKALRYYIKINSTPRILLLSATVYSSSPWNIYNLAFLLGHKWNWQKFSNEFFIQVRMGNRMIPMVKKGIDKRLSDLVKKIANVVDIAEVMDVPLQNHLEPEYFSLTMEQDKAIKDNYDPVPIVRYTQQHEIEQGILLENEFRAKMIYPCAKNDRIIALCEENSKIAIICRYNAQIDVLSSLLSQYKPYIIRGDIKDRDKVCRDAEKAEKAVVLIQADCAEGYELPSFPLCVFASMSYSYVKKVQMEGRFLRVNKPSRTTFIYLLTEGDSVDQAIYDCMLKKQDFSINLFKI